MIAAERTRPSEQLKVKSLKELQEFGIQNFASMEYRTEVMRRVSKAHGAQKAILFDDMADAASPNQREGAHRYERHLLPGLITATGFPEGAAVVVAALPASSELKYVGAYKQKLEEELGRSINYEMLYAQGDKIVDLMKLDQKDYKKLQQDTFANPDTYIRHGSQSVVIKELILPNLAPLQKTLLIPYQTTYEHYAEFANEIMANRVALPDVHEVDKAYNGLLLQEHGFKHLPKMHIIGSDGSTFKTHEQLEEAGKEAPTFKTPDLVNQLAGSITTVMDELAEEGMNAYVKLDPSGASGRGNLDPGNYPKLYDPTVDTQIKQTIVAEAIQEMPGMHLPFQVIVEEFVEAREVEGIPVDVTVCGEMIDGVFLPISVNPFGITNGSYDREWTGPNAEAIRDNVEDWEEMFRVYMDIGDVLAKNGYRNGVLAGDLFQREDGTFAQHDYNLRRGGRSVPESITALEPEGWFDGSIQISLTEASVSPGKIINAYHQICERLVEQGVLPYATGLAYGDNREPSNVRTFKILRKMESLVDEDNNPLPRDQHLAYTEAMLLNVAESLAATN